MNIGLHLVLAHQSESVIARIKSINRNRDANLKLSNDFLVLSPNFQRVAKTHFAPSVDNHESSLPYLSLEKQNVFEKISNDLAILRGIVC